MPDHVIDLPQAAQIATTAAEQVYAIPELMDMIYALVEKQSQGSHGDHFWYNYQARKEVLQALMRLALSHKAGYRRVAKFLYRQISLSAVLKMIYSKHDPVSREQLRVEHIWSTCCGDGVEADVSRYCLRNAWRPHSERSGNYTWRNRI
jgi:hypothetical protein